MKRKLKRQLLWLNKNVVTLPLLWELHVSKKRMTRLPLFYTKWPFSHQLQNWRFSIVMMIISGFCVIIFWHGCLSKLSQFPDKINYGYEWNDLYELNYVRWFVCFKKSTLIVFYHGYSRKVIWWQLVLLLGTAGTRMWTQTFPGPSAACQWR